ncbi:hypothetical protein HK100_004031 [Physocladia obscura]|uniref:Glycosyltransferase 61 catalytic domain-containing protein n=1 Tax=Physocladia obscura TaxID=109957 RepID=A0AAD5T940_9FUNG|nr:hypothetical protein HK100_004031 [Physocladia obscura]
MAVEDGSDGKRHVSISIGTIGNAKSMPTNTAITVVDGNAIIGRIARFNRRHRHTVFIVAMLVTAMPWTLLLLLRSAHHSTPISDKSKSIDNTTVNSGISGQSLGSNNEPLHQSKYVKPSNSTFSKEYSPLVDPPNSAAKIATEKLAQMQKLPPTASPRDYITRHKAIMPSSFCDSFSNADFLTSFDTLPNLVCANSVQLKDKIDPDLFSSQLNAASNYSYENLHSMFRGENDYKKKIFPHINRIKDHLINRQSTLPLKLTSMPASELNQSSSIVFSSSNEPISSNINPTSVSCGVVDDTIPQRYCDTRNIAIRLNAIPKVNDKSGLKLVPKFEQVLEGMCYLDENSWFGQGMGEGAAGWMYEGMKILNPEANSKIECDVWLNTPVFMISRWDTTNPYQFHQDAMNTFIVYSLLGLSPSQIQPIILDARHSDGPYTAAWSHIFSSSHHLIDIRQLSASAASLIPSSKSQSETQILCMRRAIWGIHGGISPMARGGRKRARCTSSPLFSAFSEFMLDRVLDSAAHESNKPLIASNLAKTAQTLSLSSTLPAWLPLPIKSTRYGLLFETTVRNLYASGHTAEAEKLAKDTIVVTYAIRKAATMHGSTEVGASFGVQFHGVDGVTAVDPVKEYIDGIEPALQRIVANENALINILYRTTEKWMHARPEKIRKVEFRAIDFAQLSFDDQMAAAHSTDLWIGPHGAAFVHLLYLRRMPFAAVLELKPPERGSSNMQFHNLAIKMDNMFSFVNIGKLVNEVQMQQVQHEVEYLLENLYDSRQS